MVHITHCIAFDNYTAGTCQNAVVSRGRLLCSTHIKDADWILLENEILAIQALQERLGAEYARCNAAGSYMGMMGEEITELIKHKAHKVKYDDQQCQVHSLDYLRSKRNRDQGPVSKPSLMVEMAPPRLQSLGEQVAQTETKIYETAEQGLETLSRIVEKTGGPSSEEFLRSVESGAGIEYKESQPDIVNDLAEDEFLKKLQESKLKLKAPSITQGTGKTESQELSSVLLRALNKRRQYIEPSQE